MNNNGTENKPEIKFCRLCGRYRSLDEIVSIQLARILNNLIAYDGCHSCSIVIHNAQVLIEEAIRRAMAEQPKIIQPMFIPPKDIKKS